MGSPSLPPLLFPPLPPLPPRLPKPPPQPPQPQPQPQPTLLLYIQIMNNCLMTSALLGQATVTNEGVSLKTLRGISIRPVYSVCLLPQLNIFIPRITTEAGASFA